jgi:hypothetical protein
MPVRLTAQLPRAKLVVLVGGEDCRRIRGPMGKCRSVVLLLPYAKRAGRGTQTKIGLIFGRLRLRGAF